MRPTTRMRPKMESTIDTSLDEYEEDVEEEVEPETFEPMFGEMDDDELAQHLEDVETEIRRRQLMAEAEDQADEASNKYLRAVGRRKGDPWEAPTGPLDSYPRGWEVTHRDKEWTSLVPYNVWEPGESGWREKPVVNPDDPEDIEYPEWEQPDGASGYDMGDMVMFKGLLYRSTFDGKNVWSPEDYPQGWELVE